MAATATLTVVRTKQCLDLCWKYPLHDSDRSMFHCNHCDSKVFTSDCPSCGRTLHDVDDVASGFLEFLRTGQYKRPEPEPPRPFRQRLASYIHCDEADVMRGNDSTQSTMPLRVLTPIGPYHGPKPLWFIRFVLNRIHRLVSQSRRAT